MMKARPVKASWRMFTSTLEWKNVAEEKTTYKFFGRNSLSDDSDTCYILD